MPYFEGNVNSLLRGKHTNAFGRKNTFSLTTGPEGCMMMRKYHMSVRRNVTALCDIASGIEKERMKRNMKNWKKQILALLLCVCMVLGMAPAYASAQGGEASGQTLTARELTGESRLSETIANAKPEQAYADDEMVTVVVLLDTPAVLAHFDPATVSLDASVGEAVADYLASEEGTALSREIRSQQDRVAAQITGSRSVDAGEVLAHWTNTVNGMALRVPYGRLAEIRELEGVTNAYVQRTFARPEEPETEAGNAGYSYDMVDVASTWAEGYTGAGMLVAVLDTGLDLEYSTYWSDAENANVTGIRRVHEAFTADSFKTENGKENVRWTNAGLAWFLEHNQLIANTGADGDKITYAGNALYKNRKVPFAADYADGDVNVRPEESDHGTHVAGTIAGFVATEEGAVRFSGVAPDAQILAMKVFPDDADSGAQEYAIINALEDSAVLGADVVNLSLGSDNGFAQDDTAAAQVYRNLRDAGVLMMTSAGNAGYSSQNSHYGDYGLAADPEISMVSAPSVYDSNLSVASINNTVSAESYLKWTDGEGTVHEAAYADSTGVAMKAGFAGETLNLPIIPVDGVGTYQDYYNAGFRSYSGYGEKGETGIALVKRGEISFADKINTATQFSWSYYDSSKGMYVTEYPIKAVLVYDNVEGSTELINMDMSSAMCTAAFLSNVDGQALADAAKEAMANGTYATLTEVEQEDRIADWTDAGQMSEFSSWGAGPALELKPEITAPGGNIWSTILDAGYREGAGTYDDYVGSYGMMSGTSMAAPHMTGITALVRQYVRDTLGYTGTDAADLAEKLMMSTALPQIDGNGVYYSPRQQGAGLVNVQAATTTPAYITVDGGIGKLELKDDPEKLGEYHLVFTVHNLTDSQLTYAAKASLLRPETTTVDSAWGKRLCMTDRDAALHEEFLGEVTVPAKGQVTVDTMVILTEEEKQELNKRFPNGTYVEGFITLTAEGDVPQIGLPMLAFYGDWTAAPILDRNSWLSEIGEGKESALENENTWGTTVFGYFDGYNFYNLGQNPFDPTAGETQTEYHQENITISPNGMFKVINDIELYQLREAKLMVVEVKDKQTGELYYRDYTAYQFKSFYDAQYGVAIPSSLYYFTATNWDGTDRNGRVLPSGTECVYTVTAYGDGEYPMAYYEDVGYVASDFTSIIPGEKEPTFNGHAMDMTGDVFSFDVQVDTEAPKLVNSAVSVYEKDGRVYLEGTFQDDGSIASVEVVPLVVRSYKEGYGDPSYAETGLDRDNPFYSELIYDADCQSWKFTADVTEYAHTIEAYQGENAYYNFDWNGEVYIYGGDFGGNDRAYGVRVNTQSGLVLSTTSARLHRGSTMDLSVINNTGSDAPITRTSSNPEVATIDEHGLITAIAPGQAVITVSNGTDSAVCVVIVEDYPTEVLDFDLSIDHFAGLKPDGTLEVNIVNLQPADVVITENTWKIYEDDPEWAGLLSVEKNSETGMSGLISMTASMHDTEIPSAGTGYLEVTLNGVTRKMTLSYDDLYKASTEDGLIPDAYYNTQTVYVTQGETATLAARYRQNHSFIPVELYTLEGYVAYDYNNPTTPGVGVILDGPTFATNGAQWSGKLVAEPGYTLPQNIKVLTRYDYGYESEMTLNGYYGGYTYNPETGEIVVANAPYGADNTLVIRADGVQTPGAPGGTVSGETWERPDGMYGPFQWAATEGQSLTGELTTAEGVTDGYTVRNVAYYTPDKPGVSYITAASKDGKYSLNFAVICLPVKPETLTLDETAMTLDLGESKTITGDLDPVPTLEEDGKLVFTSFDPSVATVDENGVVTGVSEGYAYVKVTAAADSRIFAGCIVHVTSDGCPSAAFTDLDLTEWYHPYTDAVIAGGIMNGVGNGRFDPSAGMTRAMVVTTLYRMAGEPEVTGTTSFTDVQADSYYADAVAWARETGITNGVSETSFAPDAPVTREQAVTFLYRYAALTQGQNPTPEGKLDGFADGKQVTDYAVTAMAWAVGEGMIQGSGDGRIRPQDGLTRVEAAKLLTIVNG